MDDIVFLFDVDNTLLDNDAVQGDLRGEFATRFGEAARDRYWAIFETLFAERGYADYLGALQRFRLENLHEPRLMRMASWLLDYPFADRLYPKALDAVAHVRQWGRPVVLSDGDAVFQPLKIRRSGLGKAFDDAVLIYVHKERELDDVERCFPAKRYVMIDDKLHILAAVKSVWGDRVKTVFPRQGHYAADPGELAAHPPADISLARIADLLALDRAAFAG
jgi:FMN phosphatase YigB (HAD superfamily)